MIGWAWGVSCGRRKSRRLSWLSTTTTMAGQALPKISEEVRLATFALRFPRDWLEGFDIADTFRRRNSSRPRTGNGVTVTDHLYLDCLARQHGQPILFIGEQGRLTAKTLRESVANNDDNVPKPKRMMMKRLTRKKMKRTGLKLRSRLRPVGRPSVSRCVQPSRSNRYLSMPRGNSSTGPFPIWLTRKAGPKPIT